MIEGYLDAADTRSTLAAVEALGAEVERRPRRPRDGQSVRDPRASACAAPARRQIDVGNAGTLLRLLPGLARRAARGRSGRSTATTRSAAGRSTGSPSRCARWAPALSCREERLPPLEIEGADAARDRLRAAGRQRPGQVLPALRRPARRGRDQDRRAAAEPRPHRADAGRRGRRRCAREGDAVVDRARASALEPGVDRRSRPTSPRPPSSLVAALLVPGSEVVLERVGLNPTRTGLLDDPRADGRRDRGASARASVGGEPIARPLRAARRRCTATEVGGAEVPLAIDELPLVALAACFAEGDDDDPRRRRAARARSPTGSPPWPRR